MHTPLRLFFLFIALTLLGACNLRNLLVANFESDQINALPDKTLPGDPSGDAITFDDAIRSRLRVVATSGNPGEKSLQFSQNALPNDISGHLTWLSFKGAASDFEHTVQFTWAATMALNNSTVLISVTDGNSVPLVNLEIRNNSIYMLDHYNSEPTYLGAISAKHTVLLVVKMRPTQSVWNINVFNEGIPQVSRTDIPLFSPAAGTSTNLGDVANPANPTLSFNFRSDGNFSCNDCTYAIDILGITRTN